MSTGPSTNNSKVLELLKQYTKIYGTHYNKNIKKVTVKNENLKNNQILLAIGISLHAISLRSYPDPNSKYKDSNLPLVVFDDYPKCTVPIEKK